MHDGRSLAPDYSSLPGYIPSEVGHTIQIAKTYEDLRIKEFNHQSNIVILPRPFLRAEKAIVPSSSSAIFAAPVPEYDFDGLAALFKKAYGMEDRQAIYFSYGKKLRVPGHEDDFEVRWMDSLKQVEEYIDTQEIQNAYEQVWKDIEYVQSNYNYKVIEFRWMGKLFRPPDLTRFHEDPPNVLLTPYTKPTTWGKIGDEFFPLGVCDFNKMAGTQDPNAFKAFEHAGSISYKDRLILTTPLITI